MVDFDKGDQARASYEAGLRLFSEYYSAGQTIGATLITLGSGILAASIALLDQVLPLEDSSWDPLVYSAWAALAATVLIGFSYLLLAGMSARNYAGYLLFRGEAYDLVRTANADEEDKEAKAKAIKKGEKADQHHDKARCHATARNGALLIGLGTLVASLVLFGAYVAVGPEGDGQPKDMTAPDSEEQPIESTVEVTSIDYIPVDEAITPCTGTIDLTLPGEPVPVTIYSAVNGNLSSQAQTIQIGGDDEAGFSYPICLPQTPELNQFMEASPSAVPVIQYFLDYGEPVNQDVLNSGAISEALEIAEYSTDPILWDDIKLPP